MKGCNACHTIYTVPGMTGDVGPNLTNFTVRPTIAGTDVPNTQQNLESWIMNPPGVKPGALMPVLGINQQDATDLAAFLEAMPYNPPYEPSR